MRQTRRRGLSAPLAPGKTFATIPEPGTAALLALGLGLLSLRSRTASR